MKKIKNKFIYFIILLILCIIFSIIYLSFFKNPIDKYSYVELISGDAYLNSTMLVLNEKRKLSKGDKLKTGGGNSMVIIEWGDGSITRLGENTNIEINENYISNNKNIIKIIFTIFSGKTWSNVFSYVPGDSHFKQVFEDKEISVRGTVFSLDLDKGYVYVNNHSVILRKKGEALEIQENQPFNIFNSEKIPLDKFILELRDKYFFSKNIDLDKKWKEFIKKELNKHLKYLKELSKLDLTFIGKEELEKTYNSLLSAYQELNFIKTIDGEELFSLKMSIKEKLMDLASSDEKKILAYSFFYDLKDIIENKNYYYFDGLTHILIKYKEYFDFFSFLDFVESIKIYDIMSDSVKKDIEGMKSVFFIAYEIAKEVAKKNIKIQDDLINKIGKVKNNIEEEVYLNGKEFGKQILNKVKKLQEFTSGSTNDIKNLKKNLNDRLKNFKITY